MQQVLEAIADPNRRKILDLLRSGEKSAGELTAALGVSGASVSHHLNKLRAADLVIQRREGQYIYYSIHTSVFEDAAQYIIEFFRKD